MARTLRRCYTASSSSIHYRQGQLLRKVSPISFAAPQLGTLLVSQPFAVTGFFAASSVLVRTAA